MGLNSSWSGLITSGTVVFLMALTIRLMDDYLDKAYDELQGIKTLGSQLGTAVLPYSLMLFAASVTLQPRLAVVLFLAAYGVGMVGDLNRQLPTGLKGWQEAILALILGVRGAGFTAMAWAFVLMLAVQCIDDLMDHYQDLRVGQRNLCMRIGRGETALLAACCFVLSLLLSSILTVSAFAAVIVLQVLLPHVSNAQV